MSASIAVTLRAATQQLTEAEVPGAARDARVLLAHVLGVAPTRLSLMGPDLLGSQELEQFQALIARRRTREPVSHLTGQREFFGRHFHVSAAVLDPRPETECLIAAALKLPWRSVLDLGTGSGAILLTLLAERPGTTGLGVDLSPEALEIARKNRDAFGLNAGLQQGNWGAGLDQRFDLITCNPPYISAQEYAALAPEPRLWEPAQALTPGGDGLGAYRQVCAQAPDLIAPGGHILFEIGPTQAQAVSDLLVAEGCAAPQVLPDLDGRDRVVLGRFPA